MYISMEIQILFVMYCVIELKKNHLKPSIKCIQYAVKADKILMECH